MTLIGQQSSDLPVLFPRQRDADDLIRRSASQQSLAPSQVRYGQGSDPCAIWSHLTNPTLPGWCCRCGTPMEV